MIVSSNSSSIGYNMAALAAIREGRRHPSPLLHSLPLSPIPCRSAVLVYSNPPPPPPSPPPPQHLPDSVGATGA